MNNDKGSRTFGDDVAFLKKHADVIVLSQGDARVAVTPRYQGRVMTSAAHGESGASYGWINYDLVARGKRQPHINVFGGEDRIWLGPEGGQFSIFFKQDDPFDLEHWETPAPIDWGGWDLLSQNDREARFGKKFAVTNFSNTRFDVAAERTVRILSMADISKVLGTTVPHGLAGVGYTTENRITNAGATPWTKDGGLLSIWILGMFRPSPTTTIVIPFKPGTEAQLGPVVNDAYFGKVPGDRLKIDPKGVLFFRGDGQYRSKIGIPPLRARDVAGSYDAAAGVLTVVKFTLPEGAADYVNSMWEIQAEPFKGDVANSYNDGPPAPGKPPMGPFYELESSSPAAALAPKASLMHRHTTVHLQGTRATLDPIARAVFGVGLDAIAGAF
jgi:hypothetical protein